MVCECELCFICSCLLVAHCAGDRDKVELRAQGNITLGENLAFDTLRVYYNRHNNAGSREVYLKPPVGVKSVKGSSFCLEIFIHEDRVSATTCFHYYRSIILILIQYYERTREDNTDSESSTTSQLKSKSKKRKAADSVGSRKRSCLPEGTASPQLIMCSTD